MRSRPGGRAGRRTPDRFADGFRSDLVRCHPHTLGDGEPRRRPAVQGVNAVLKRCVPRSVAARRAGRMVPRGIAVELVATPCAFVGAARDRCPIEEASLAIRGSAYERGHVARRQWRGLLSSCYVSVLRAARWGVWEISSLGERQPSGRSGCRAVGSDQVRRSDELSELPALWPKRLSASPGDRAAVLPALRRPRADPVLMETSTAPSADRTNAPATGLAHRASHVPNAGVVGVSPAGRRLTT